MSTEWHNIFTPTLETVRISYAVSAEFANAPRGAVSIHEIVTPDDSEAVNIPIESAELLAKTLLKMEQAMETPKHSLEAVAIWDKAKINPKGPVKRFCAYGATEYGTDLDAVKVLDTRAVALMDLADQFARFPRMISRVSQAANN